jgi:hypothetical protein
MKSTPTLWFSIQRLVLLTLVSFVAVAAVLGIAASANKANREAKALKALQVEATQTVAAKPVVIKSSSGQQSLAPNAATVTATLSDNVASGSKVPPGGTINYTATISNAGVSPADDAGSVTYSATLDANTAISGLVSTSTIAINDIYPQTVIGNVSINSANIPYSVVTNDYQGQNGGAVTISAFDATTTQGGQVVMTTSGVDIGKFTYNPPPGFEGNDTFTYTISNSVGGSTSTVTIPVAGMVWFINNGAAACTTLAGGCGRLSNPFSTLAAFSGLNTGAGNNPAVNDNIFVFESATTYTGGVTLLGGQKFIGQDATDTLPTITGLTPPSGSTAFPAMNTGGNATTITNGSGAGITLNGSSTSNSIRGLTVTNTSAAKISGSSFGTLTVGKSGSPDVTLSGTGQALNLTIGSFAATSAFTSVAATSSAAQGINITSVSGTVAFGSTTTSSTTNQGISVTNSAVNIAFGNTSVTTSGGTGVNLTTNTGTLTFADLDVTPNSGQRGLVATDNTNTLTVTSGDFTTTGAGSRAIEIDGPAARTPINLTFTLVTASNASNSISLVDVSGTKFQVTGTTQINTRAGTGIFVDSSTTPTIQFATVNIPNPSAAGGYGMRVEDSSSAVTVATATISDPNVTTAQNDGDTNGIPDSDGDGDAIFLTNNTGSFTLNGGTLSNCGNDGIDLRNASTLVLSGVSISNPGQDVTGATGAGFGGHGIWAFNLTGTSSITGGTISGFNTGNRDGMTFTNQTSTAQTLTIQGTTFQNAIGNRGLAVSGQATANMTVTVGGASNNVATNCTFTNILGTAVQVSAGGAPAGSTATVNFTLQNSTFQTAPLDGKMNVIGSNVEAGKLTLNILNNTFNNVFVTASTGEGLLSFSADGTLAGNTFGATISGNSINNVGTANSNCAGGAVRCLGPGNTVLVFIDDAANVPNTIVIDSNTITNTQQGGILLDMANTGAPSSTVNGKITNNCVGKIRTGATCGGADAPVGAGAGLANGRGIAVERRRNNSLAGNVLISGNTIRNGAGQSAGALNTPGIFVRTKANANLSATITNNSVDTNLVGAAEIRLDTNANDAGDIVAPVQCDDLTGNTFPAGAGALIDINETNGTHNVEQASAAAVTAANGGVGVTADAGVSFGVACAAPPPIAPPATEGANNTTRSSDNNGSLATISDRSRSETLTTTRLLRVAAKEAPLVAKAGAAVANHEKVSDPNEGRRSHHAQFKRPQLVKANADDQQPLAPLSGEPIGPINVGTLPAGKSVIIKYAATVNTPPLVRQISHQGSVSFTNGASPVSTTDPGPPVVNGATVTLIDTLMTWNGVTSTDWNTATNWTPPAGGTQYAPGVSNPGVNDVVIPTIGFQPNIITPDVSIYSLALGVNKTLTIDSGRTLTITGTTGSDFLINGTVVGGALNFAGAGPHVITNPSGTGSISSTNVKTLLSPAVVNLNNDLQMGALAVNSGATMNITGRTLSLNGAGAALTVGGTLTTATSTVVLNGSVAQTIAGVAYNNLTINNSIGLNVTGVTLNGNATVNGAFALTSSDLDTAGFTLTQPNTTASTGVSDVVGTVKRTGGPFAPATTLTFGNPNNQITFGAAGTKPTDVTVVMAKAAPATYPTAVLRNYTLSQTGGSGFTATLRLHYLDSELNGNLPETSLTLRRFNGTGWAPVTPTLPDTTNNWLESAAVTTALFSTQWTFSTFTPTASSGVVSGRIVDDHGMPVEGAVVRLDGTQSRKFITDANGVYRFDNVQTGGFYTVTPSRANYSFNPSVRSFSQLGETTEAAFGATLSTSTFVNPLDTPEYFVRQHYIDFLGREPDEAGFNFWSDQILECGADANCVERRRENVSAAYFLSIEFQKTGGLVDGLYRASYGVRPDFAQFMPDTRAVGQGVVVGTEGWEAKLAANKEAFINAFVNRATFVGVYGNLDNNAYVDALISHTGVQFTAGERDALVSGLANGTQTRADVLRSIAENNRFANAKFNEAFVMMEYFGYLRRDPDANGFAFWLNKLNEFNGNFERAEMVKAFIVSGEYRDRFPR